MRINRVSDNIGKVMASAFEDPYERFERIFFEEAEKEGFFKMFSIDGGMIKLALGRGDLTQRELGEGWRERNIGKVTDWVLKEQEQEETIRAKTRQLVNRAKIEVEQLARTNAPFEQIVQMVKTLLGENYPQDRLEGFVSNIMERVKGKKPEQNIPMVSRIPAKV